jgi:hypothetical protein
MRSVLLGLLVACVLAAPALGWWVKGHETVAEAACLALPDDVPAFFRGGAKQLAHSAGDPDRWKNPGTPHLRSTEYPDHFLDWEDYQGKPLPANRYKAIALLIELKQNPEKAGMLPYAIMENYDRLSCAFYDHRQDPESAPARAKCLVYAGVLSHYTGDAVMPLHTTRDYDGRKGPDGRLRQKGIHAKIDAFPERNGLTAEEISRDVKPRKIDDVWAYVVKTLEDSHKLVGRCYELDEAGVFDKPTPESRQFILDRCRAGAQFTADLWYNAWLRSATLPKPY